MLESTFESILMMSITAAIAAVLIIGIRLILGERLPKLFSYSLWIIVLLRLLIPFSFASAFSIFNVIPVTEPAVIESSQINSSIEYGNNISNNADNQRDSIVQIEMPDKDQTASADQVQIRMFIASLVWIAVAALLLIVNIYFYIKANCNLRTSSLYKDNGLANTCSKKIKIKRKVKIYTSDKINTPIVRGIINPSIVIPLDLDKNINEDELKYIITHELVHIKRLDYIIKPLSVLLLWLHWFNPFIWISFILFQKDMEMSCDEKVLSVYNNDIRGNYATSLINIAARQSGIINGGLLAFGESNIKSRIKSIMKYKKTKVWLSIIAVIILLVSGITLLTNEDNRQTEIKSEYSKDINNDLLKFRSRYIGDASNDSNLISMLPLGEYKEGIRLSTDKKPYGINVNYNINDEKVDRKNIEYLLKDNASIIFSLIENVEIITFNITGEETGEYTFLRDEIEKYFEDGLWEYSKTEKTFKDLLNKLSLKIHTFPDKYSMTMSSVPGIKILADYNSEENYNIKYTADKGVLHTWDEITFEVSDSYKDIRVEKGIPVYWSPDNKGIKNDIVFIEIIDNGGNIIFEDEITIVSSDSIYYTVQPAYNLIISNDNKNLPDIKYYKTIDEAVGNAIKAQGNFYGRGECITQGHIILDKEENDETIKVYTVSSVGWFGFENGIFTKVSGSGGLPTVIILGKNEEGKLKLKEYQEPLDGAGYVESIKKMFPKKLHDRVLGSNDYSDLKEQQEKQAKDYLISIGRTAKVSVDHVEKELVRIDVDASNKLFAELTKFNSFLNTCPYWIGTKEEVENGIRYIYETAQSKSSDGYDLVIFTKSIEDGTIIEKYTYKIAGSEPQLINENSISSNEEVLWTENDWTYYIEKLSKEHTKIPKGMAGRLYRKQKNGTFEVLDELVKYRDLTIILADNRIAFIGFAGTDIMDFKTPSLISIKKDGTDRKVYNTKFNVARQICYDKGYLYYEGWTNARAFPRPVCRINTDLTGDIKMADIDGEMITVHNGYVYYLNGDIYRLKLDWSSEPEIYDKADLKNKNNLTVKKVTSTKYEVYYSEQSQPYILNIV